MADDDARMNKKAVRFLFGGVLVAGLAGSFLGGLFHGREDTAVAASCWPNHFCVPVIICKFYSI